MQAVLSKPRDADLIRQVGTCKHCGGSPCIPGTDEPVERYAVPVQEDRSNVRRGRPWVFAAAKTGEDWRCGPCTIEAYHYQLAIIGKALNI